MDEKFPWYLRPVDRCKGVLTCEEELSERDVCNGWVGQGIGGGNQGICGNSTNIIDNSPVSVIEAWSYGLPVVTTNVGGIPYMVNDGVNVLLAESGDAQGIAAKVVNIIESPELARSLSRNGREAARKSTWENVRPLWERVFEETRSRPAASQIRQSA